ncbi:heme-binding domain-containing protein [Flavihumibacter rivuli]|uniref:heme-binding domain-containing protein n=1 Tax=Flavihumibacter rivuli TaxID=2838156 RepID=UPI001BDF0229|nr:heme-binding domain-containing protein [Flavihumibacter rivuli]ULQ56323.1 heme-binding domain-containing protein [Flavihumibacter rivuli]
MIKKILTALLVILLVLQVFRPKKDNNASAPSPANINQFASVPDDVDKLLRTSCYDCHSNTTVYPWYTNIQPIGWWLEDHIKEGKGELNFDEFGNYNLRRQYHKLEEVAELVKENEMPLKSYTLVHTEAKLSEEQKQQIILWTDKAMGDMRAKYPIDSLVKKK